MKREEPFLQELLPYLLQRASFLVTRRFHQHLRLHKVSVSRWRLLAWLSEHQPCSINQLVDQLMLQQPSVSALVDKSVADGLVLKISDPVDARRVGVELSEKGAKLVGALKVQARQAEGEVIASLGDDVTDDLKALLRDVISRAESDQI